MKKRILSILLTICMVLMLCPVTAFAANGDATALQNLLNGGGTVTLSKDYTIDTTLSVKNTVTLDLNGHVIKMTGSGSVISIAWSNLTLQDSSPTATHTDASLPAGGVITGGNAAYGGGVYVGSRGSMTMNGGTIKKCSAECGGGVYVGNGGSMTMNGGTIANCTATTSDYTYGGGGVYVGNGGSMTMNGGTIENCSSKTSGGGVFSTSNFSMSGNAIIRGCSAKAGGGVRTDKSSMTMNGGTIEACTSTNGTSDAVTISFASLLANGGIVKGTVTFGSRSAINTTSTDSCTKFYNEVTNNGTISGGVYYGGIQNDSSGTVSDPYHTVTFDTNGGSSVPTQWFVNTDKAPALQPADPTRENSVFMGWYNGDAKYDFTQSVTSDMTLTAKWVTTNVSTEAELKEALNAGATSIKLVSDINLSSTLDLTDKNITLDLNGHVLTGNIQLADSSALPQSILTLIDSNPTATHADSSLPAGGVVKGNITLTRGNGSASHLYANGGTVTGQTSLPSYAGGIFCTSDTPTAFKAYVGNYGEIHGGIFYGSIKESCIKENTVTFMNGDSRYALEVVASGNKVVAPISTPLKAGYDFEGWYNGDTKYTFGSTLSESITLTAKFSNPKTYNISYDLDGGTATNPATYNVESDAITLNNPAKTGYTFTGWSGTGLTGENNMAVTIAKGSTGDRTYTAHFSQNSYTVAFDTVGGSSISDKTGVTWTDKVLDGITAPTKDGWEFTGWKCGDKTVNENTQYSDLVANDTVASVTLAAQWKDITAPTGEISVGTNKWKGFLNTITFGLFFKDTQSVTITASDNSGDAVKIEYLLSDKELDETELANATFTSYTKALSINPDNKYVIYAKLTDKVGNVSYLSSDGIVLDATAPVITGIENGKTYCEAKTVTVTEDYIESVKVNGTAVTLDANNQFTLNPAEGTQTIVAIDKAGNETSVTVTVNNGHTAGNDDGNCTTPVYCIYHPDTVVVAANSHDFSGEWHNDGTGHWHICQNDGCTVAEPKASHFGTDDGDCTTAVICECGYTITAANAEHTYGEWQSNGNDTHTRYCTVDGCNGSEDGDCEGGQASYFKKAVCDTCHAEYGALLTDTTAPTGEITVGTNKWNSFLNTITFGLFFKDTQGVTITAADDSYNHDGYTEDKAVKVEYYLYSGDTALTEADLANKEFTIYNGDFNINPDNKYVVYAKLTDHAGNVTYISSEGVVLDATAPVISGVENGKTYCEAQTVTVDEKYTNIVTVNGTAVTLDANNQFTLNPAEGTQTIVVTDKAGNEVSVTVTVNDGHTAGNDDGNCTTPVYCIYHPDAVVIEAKSHDFSGEWHNDGTGHWHICQNDGCTVAETKASHFGTDDGDCTTAVICECGYTITAANADHTYEWQSENGQYWKKCQYCDDETAKKDIPTITINGADAVCVTQDYKFSFTLPEGATDAVYGYEFENKGDLGLPAIIENNEPHGVVSMEWYEPSENSFKVYAGAKTADGFEFFVSKTVALKSEHTDAAPKDHICDICGATLSEHTGGEATCVGKAICEYCGEEYGELDGTNHNLEKTPAKDATVTETGNKEYWHCKDCGKYFSDENGTNELKLADTVIAKLPPEIIKGAGQSITEGEKKELSFTSNAAFSDFIRVELDGKTLDEKNYTVKEGSTVVTLKADYVATLSAGEHTIGIVSTNGTATTTFTVNAKAVVDNDTKSPQTGDNSHMALWIALLFASGAVVIGTTVYSKRKRVR